MTIHYCSRCVYPSSSAAPITFDDAGVCSGCRVSLQKTNIDWAERWELFRELVDQYRQPDNYDVVIGVSGGKDSYFLAHLAKKLDLKPLLVTYYPNNYLPEGERNLNNMHKAFDCDHHIVRPGQDVLIKMNRLGFRLQGDMNWHAHCGINTVPIQTAVRHKVPLMFWGEHGWSDLGGMYSMNDFPEFTAKARKEHDLRGFDWNDFTDEGLDKLGRADLKEGLSEKDLLWAKYPSDDEIDNVGVRGIFQDFYMPWSGDENAHIAQENYGWIPSQTPFERTYKLASNLDDMHENGIHDYLKFIKFGYGRCTDHAMKDIRAGKMKRSDAINEIRKRDHIKPKDLKRWLAYVNMTESEFDYTCDTFRDPRVWRIESEKWIKDNIWGEPSSYGPVFLNKDQWGKYQQG